ncbi:hypothetical protein [Halarchaeum nitratireducens]|nr:hypothetical protein [Halarchaeum nitratireducens]
MVAAPVAGSIASPAAPDGPAATGSGTCSFASVLHFFGVADDCVVGSTTTEVQQVKNAEDNQTALQIYNAAAAQQASSKQLLASTANYANDTRNVAWSKAEVAYYQALENDSVKEVAREKAMRAIEDYYTKRQMSLVKSWEVNVHAAYDLHERGANESGIPNDLVDIVPHGPPASNAANNEYGNPGSPEWNKTVTVDYVNGSTTQMFTFGGSKPYIDASSAGHYSHAKRDIDGDDHASRQSGNYLRIVVHSPEGSDIGQSGVFNSSKYTDRWQQYGDLSAELKTEFSTYANNTYPAVESGRINASEVVSRETRMFQLGTQAGQSGSLYDSVAALSMMGLATPNLNGTGTMTVNYQNRQYHGLLLAPEVPNGTWTAGTSYNATAPPLNGSAVLATTTGETVPLDSGTFRLASISSQNGESMQSVNATRSQYQTTNVTKLVEQLNETQRLIEDVEARQATGSNPSGSSSGSPLDGDGPIYLVVGLSIISLLVVVALQRDR